MGRSLRVVDVLEEMRDRFTEISVPASINVETIAERRLLIFVHTFDAGGSQAAVLELLPLLQEAGYQVFIVSLGGVTEDVYRGKYMAAGAVCALLDHFQNTRAMRDWFQETFDAVLINSLCSQQVLCYFINGTIPVIWWVHETEKVMRGTAEFFPPAGGISENIRFAAITEEMREGIQRVYGKDATILPLLIQDLCGGVRARERAEGDPVRFVMPGTYSYGKGQDLLLQAVAKLPSAICRKTEFLLCGHLNQDSEADVKYADALTRMVGELPNVKMLGELPREECYRLYETCDCVVAPSRLDSGPMTVIEGMMLGRLALVSSAAGISRYIRDCVDGFVFPSEDVDELYKRLLLIATDVEGLQPIAEKGRKLYEERFSPDAARRGLRELLAISSACIRKNFVV